MFIYENAKNVTSSRPTYDHLTTLYVNVDIHINLLIPRLD